MFAWAKASFYLFGAAKKKIDNVKRSPTIWLAENYADPGSALEVRFFLAPKKAITFQPLTKG